MDRLLLDTCALLWLAEGAFMTAEAREAIAKGARHVSPISAWEIANLARKNRIAFTMPVGIWINQAFSIINADQPALTTPILIESCGLPGAPPDDPADRIIIATARAHQLTIVTRDRAILAYAQTGQVKAMPC
jgi:PIN domain nuclease of toxin-antitoxin system